MSTVFGLLFFASVVFRLLLAADLTLLLDFLLFLLIIFHFLFDTHFSVVTVRLVWLDDRQVTEVKHISIIKIVVEKPEESCLAILFQFHSAKTIRRFILRQIK